MAKVNKQFLYCRFGVRNYKFLSNRIRAVMSTLIKKSREGTTKKALFKTMPSAVTPNNRVSSSTSAFEQAYSLLLHRRDNDFSPLESPNLNQQLQHLPSNDMDDPYRSALSTPPPKTIIALERRKYLQLKQRIDLAVQQTEQINYSSLKELFTAKQTLFTEFLNAFAGELERECKEKADILKYLWNSSQHLLESISEALSSSAKQKERSQIANNLRSHLEYQELLGSYQKRQVALNERSNMERVTINKLVYQLRFKRKEVNKLYRNQRLLVNRLNEYKSENLHLQSSYIDLMCSLRDVPPEKVELLLKARDEVRRSQKVSFKINANRKNTRNEIKAELSNEKIEELESLYEEIKEIANNQANSPHLISTLIEASIQNFGIKNDDTNNFHHSIQSVPQKLSKINAETQINEFDIRDKTKSSEVTQFGYIQRLKQELINNKDTQTYCQYPKKKLLINVQSQVDPAAIYRKFAIFKVYNEFFKYQSSSQTTIKVIGSSSAHTDKRHKKNYSDFNPRKSYQKLSSNDLDDFIEEKDDQSSSNDSVDEENFKGGKWNNKRVSKLKKSSNKMINMHANAPKERYTSILSNSSIKVLSSSTNLDSDLNAKKSNFAPFISPTPSNQAALSLPFPNLDFIPPTVIITPAEKQSLAQAKKPRSSVNTRDSVRKAIIPKFKKTQPHEQSRHNFLQKSNYFNIEIDAAKQEQINNVFCNNEYTQIEPDSDDEDFRREEEEAEQEQLERIKAGQLAFLSDCSPEDKLAKRNNRKNSGMSATKSIRSRRPSSSMKYGDENELLLNLCRVSYYKSHRKLKEKLALYKYHDEFTSVRDKIEFVARDVRDLVVHREALLRKTINTKNLKNTYKILMMTFSKAYDAYNKGVLKGNLIYPLFESFALLYGAINNNEIYKKMINFIASLAISRQNAILRFFLFFLGLDSASPYSERVTVSEVYLCLKLLEKISVDGKVTLNIESIYTDTTKIKDQLLRILSEEKIPASLSEAIDCRVAKELQNSCLYKNSSTENSHLKLNIYNIILLVIQEVIKCKNSLRDAFLPLLQRYEQFQTNKKVPVYVIEVLFSDWKATTFDPLRLRALLEVVTKNGKRETVTLEQFCSILFQCSLVSIDQLHLGNEFIYRRNWKIPTLYFQEIQSKIKRNEFKSALEQHEIEMFMKIAPKGSREQMEGPNIEKMRRIIFEKHYQRKVRQVVTAIVGSDLMDLAEITSVLDFK